MAETIKPADAVPGRFYLHPKYGVGLSCGTSDSEYYLPAFVFTNEGGGREFRPIGSGELTPLPDCDSLDWKPPAAIDPEQGWRLLEPGERPLEFDECRIKDGYYHDTWDPNGNWGGGEQSPLCYYRRRIEPATPEPPPGHRLIDPSVDEPHGNELVYYPPHNEWKPRSPLFARFSRGYHYCRPIAPEPVYRPFASAAEFEPHRDRWVKRVDDSPWRGRAVAYHETWAELAHHCARWGTAFNEYTFDDGKPFGVEVTQ